jgi:hypothetical protein
MSALRETLGSKDVMAANLYQDSIVGTSPCEQSGGRPLGDGCTLIGVRWLAGGLDCW